MTTINEEGDSISCEMMTHVIQIIMLIFMFMMYIFTRKIAFQVKTVLIKLVHLNTSRVFE